MAEANRATICSRCGSAPAIASSCNTWNGPVCNSCSYLPYQPHEDEISGHPVRELYLAADVEPTLITVCATCGQMKTILFLSKDRWLCFHCKSEGHTKPQLYPIT